MEEEHRSEPITHEFRSLLPKWHVAQGRSADEAEVFGGPEDVRAHLDLLCPTKAADWELKKLPVAMLDNTLNGQKSRLEAEFTTGHPSAEKVAYTQSLLDSALAESRREEAEKWDNYIFDFSRSVYSWLCFRGTVPETFTVNYGHLQDLVNAVRLNHATQDSEAIHEADPEGKLTSKRQLVRKSGVAYMLKDISNFDDHLATFGETEDMLTEAAQLKTKLIALKSSTPNSVLTKFRVNSTDELVHLLDSAVQTRLSELDISKLFDLFDDDLDAEVRTQFINLHGIICGATLQNLVKMKTRPFYDKLSTKKVEFWMKLFKENARPTSSKMYTFFDELYDCKNYKTLGMLAQFLEEPNFILILRVPGAENKNILQRAQESETGLEATLKTIERFAGRKLIRVRATPLEPLPMVYEQQSKNLIERNVALPPIAAFKAPEDLNMDLRKSFKGLYETCKDKFQATYEDDSGVVADSEKSGKIETSKLWKTFEREIELYARFYTGVTRDEIGSNIRNYLPAGMHSTDWDTQRKYMIRSQIYLKHIVRSLTELATTDDGKVVAAENMATLMLAVRHCEGGRSAAIEQAFFASSVAASKTPREQIFLKLNNLKRAALESVLRRAVGSGGFLLGYDSDENKRAQEEIAGIINYTLVQYGDSLHIQGLDLVKAGSSSVFAEYGVPTARLAANRERIINDTNRIYNETLLETLMTDCRQDLTLRRMMFSLFMEEFHEDLPDFYAADDIDSDGDSLDEYYNPKYVVTLEDNRSFDDDNQFLTPLAMSLLLERLGAVELKPEHSYARIKEAEAERVAHAEKMKAEADRLAALEVRRQENIRKREAEQEERLKLENRRMARVAAERTQAAHAGRLKLEAAASEAEAEARARKAARVSTTGFEEFDRVTKDMATHKKRMFDRFNQLNEMNINNLNADELREYAEGLVRVAAAISEYRKVNPENRRKFKFRREKRSTAHLLTQVEARLNDGEFLKLFKGKVLEHERAGIQRELEHVIENDTGALGSMPNLVNPT